MKGTSSPILRERFPPEVETPGAVGHVSRDTVRKYIDIQTASSHLPQNLSQLLRMLLLRGPPVPDERDPRSEGQQVRECADRRSTPSLDHLGKSSSKKCARRAAIVLCLGEDPSVGNAGHGDSRPLAPFLTNGSMCSVTVAPGRSQNPWDDLLLRVSPHWRDPPVRARGWLRAAANARPYLRFPDGSFS